MSEALNTILERFKHRTSYYEQDKTALDISRAAAAGSIGDPKYSEWALITNDPLVIINYVKTYITVLASKLASSPFTPANDALAERCLKMRLNAQVVDLFSGVLGDGYAFLGLGMLDDDPVATIIDARYVMYNGNDPTLKDATEVIVFEVLAKSSGDDFVSTFPGGFVEFDSKCEKVRTSHYKLENGIVTLDIYEEGKDEPEHFTIPNVDRIPVVRFYGEKFELDDKRYHYRGLYYQLAGVIKAMALAATKIQIRVATSDDDNYILTSDAIANNKNDWRNSAAKTIDHVDANGDPIADPVIPIQHDNQFLLSALEQWKSVTTDLLGPVVQSGREAITREEVLARNEVRDALANTYLEHVADSLAEVYRIINSMITGDNAAIMVMGGFLEETKRTKKIQEIANIYNLAKESGLNSQGFILEILANADLPIEMKNRLGKLLMTDPFASPQMQQMRMQLASAQKTISDMQQQMVLLRIQASQRLERQAEWVQAQERMKRGELQFKQWQEENKNTQEARMEVLRQLLQQGDTVGALAMLNTIQQIDPPVLAEPESQMLMNQNNDDIKQDYMENANVGNNTGGIQWNQQPAQQAAAATVQPATGTPAI